MIRKKGADISTAEGEEQDDPDILEPVTRSLGNLLVKVRWHRSQLWWTNGPDGQWDRHHQLPTIRAVHDGGSRLTFRQKNSS